MTTVKLERWRGHLTAARKQGLSLARYAREHGISRYTLYAAQRQLRGAGEAKPVPRAARVSRRSPFVAVEVAPAPTAPLRARLPNGVELVLGELDAAACAQLIGVLAALPCSG